MTKFMKNLEAVYLEAPGKHRASVIWLHGLGADGNDFVPIVPELGLPEDHGIRFIFPHAPVRPVTLNGGMAMRAWYDILSLKREGLQDEKGMRDSDRLVRHYVESERGRGIAANKIVLAGFSQGGAIALHTGLRYPQALAGLLALSTYLPLGEKLAAEACDANRSVAILMCHGSFDPVLPCALGEQSRRQLEQQGYPVEWREYPMQHQVCAEEIEEIGIWLQKVLR